MKKTGGAKLQLKRLRNGTQASPSRSASVGREGSLADLANLERIQFPPNDTKLKQPNYQLSINWCDGIGFSLMHWKIFNSDYEKVLLLISSRADINIMRRDKLYPLDYAIELNNEDIINLLIENGAKSKKYPIAKYQQKSIEYQSKNDQILVKRLEDKTKQELKLNYLYFTKLPDIDKFSHLQILQISSNNLISIPREIYKIQSLKSLDISFNLLNQIDNEIKNLTNLENLRCSNNYFIEFPESVLELENLTLVNFSNNQISYLPTTITALQKLKKLFLSHNLIKQLPKCILELSCLEQLVVSHNLLTHLKDLPVHLFLMLNTLDISFNQLTTIEYSNIMTSKDIKTFIYKNNPFPEQILRILDCFYMKTKALDLSGLSLTEIAPEIQLLTQLTDLNLRSNLFTSLPTFLASLTELKSLDISYNRIADLPLFIVRLQKLQNLNIDETKNYLINPPKPVVERGLKSIIGHYQDLLQGDPCFRLKLMFVGQGGYFYSLLSLSSFSLPFHSLPFPPLQFLLSFSRTFLEIPSFFFNKFNSSLYLCMLSITPKENNIPFPSLLPHRSNSFSRSAPRFFSPCTHGCFRLP